MSSQSKPNSDESTQEAGSVARLTVAGFKSIREEAVDRVAAPDGVGRGQQRRQIQYHAALSAFEADAAGQLRSRPPVAERSQRPIYQCRAVALTYR